MPQPSPSSTLIAGRRQVQGVLRSQPGFLCREGTGPVEDQRAHHRHAGAEKLADDHAKKPGAAKEGNHRKEAGDRLEFFETDRTLDDVAGHDEAKAWLREDARLLKKNAARALPMGYLVSGRIGTGKTYLVECFAGECGVPFVVLRNFREKWVGATEGNLEKIFSILHALGQVIVFVDEADQMTGRRDSGTGDSACRPHLRHAGARDGRHAKPRQDPLDLRHQPARPARGRPERQGRLDVHILSFRRRTRPGSAPSSWPWPRS